MLVSGAFLQLATVDQVATLLRAVSTLLWPLVAGVFLVLFRAPITELLRRLTRAKVLGQEAEFDRLASRVQGQIGQRVTAPIVKDDDLELSALRQLTSTSPTGSIVEALAHIERELRNLLEDDGVDADDIRSYGAVGLSQLALEKRIITSVTANAIEGLTVMRNVVSHREATEERAAEYVTLADSVLFAIRQNARNHDRRATAAPS